VAARVAVSVTTAGRAWDPSAYAAAMVSVSTAVQMVVFVAVGGLADHGPWRKGLLSALSLVGALATVLCVTVTPATWWVGGLLLVLVNVAYGASYVVYNSYLPDLAACTPAVRRAPPRERAAAFTAAIERISSAGFAWGYTGSVLCLLLCVGITAALSDDTILAYRLNVLVAGVWWAVFGVATLAWLRPRPGPPLPPGESYAALPWKQLARTLARARELPHTFGFLACWFGYSDGFNVIASVGALYANSSVAWTFSKSLGLAGLLVVVPVFAALGNVLCQWASVRLRVSARALVALNCACMALVPAYGLLGYAHRALGYRRWWELYIAVIWYGLHLGSVQSFSRALFGRLVPRGLEAQFFALFSVTDRGSSWIGPAVVAATIQASGGALRLAFVYPLVALTVPCVALLLGLDPARGEADARAYAQRHGTARHLAGDDAHGDGGGGGGVDGGDGHLKAPAGDDGGGGAQLKGAVVCM
jgi:UMF1 family MFS transporter